jgi:outer membrane protein assembly factor BamB
MICGKRAGTSTVKVAEPLVAGGRRHRIQMTLLATVVLAFGVGRIAAVSSAATVAPASPSPTYTWPEFHSSPALNGVSLDPTISTSNASTLGVKWMDPLGASLDSPMAAYSSTLNMTVAYEGGKAGFLNAVDVTNGHILWSDYLGAAITSSPLVVNGSVWIAPSATGRIYKINAATGATQCSGTIVNTILSTPVAADPPGGVPSVYFAAIGAGTLNGPVEAYAQSDCTELWTWSDYIISGQTSGVWDPLSYAVDESGTGLLLFGSANPDSTVYALNAASGAEIWHYSTYSPASEDWDVGAGVDVSAPGVNGFADGMAYVEGKDGIFFALDLTTGALVWEYNFGGNSPTNPTATTTDALSTPALSGQDLVFGDNTGVYSLDAVTGAELWFVAGTGDINSSLAIVGPANSQVVAYGDLNGYFHVISLQSGAMLYTYETGSYITASPADVNGNLLMASNDGFLYDFDLNGGNGDVPTTTVTSPASGATLPNPNGSLTIAGTASAADGVANVTVQVVMNGANGPWFHESTGTFSAGLYTSDAYVHSKNADTTKWSLVVPVPAQAASYQVYASAVGENGVADGTAYASTSNAASVQFDVDASSTAPVVDVSPARVVPGGTVDITGSGFEPSATVTLTAKTLSGDTVTLATVTANSAGAIDASAVNLPLDSAFGSDPITATGDSSGDDLPLDSAFGSDPITATGNTSADIGVGYTYISNNDPQFAYGPEHLGDEQNDKVIASYQGVSESSRLQEQWTVAAQGSTDTTPAINEGVIYYGDEAGYFYGLTETTGEPVFAVTVGSPIESDPAVDGEDVYFGDDGGDAVALNSANGASAWSTDIGGDVSSPTVVGDTVYVGSSNGDVDALNTSTGDVDWTASAGGPVSSAPAVDAKANLVVVTDSSGTVEAFSATTGESAWTATAGGSVTGAMISGADVYVATSAGDVVALTVTDGASDWTASTGSAITAPPVLADGLICVGTAAGEVSYFKAASGTLVNTQTQFGDPITGITVTGGLILLTSSAGNLGLILGAHYLKMTWKWSADTDFSSPGVFLNGDVFVLGEDGLLRAFTTPNRSIT